MTKGKVIVVSAPSGCGKSTIINSIFDSNRFDLHFSVSATNRPPRAGEVDGDDYHFLSTEEFQRLVAEDQFIEWEEVYPERYYGTLRAEVDRQLEQGHNVVLDIDVKGALNVKRFYGSDSCCIFIEPPSIDEMRRRLENRGTESSDSITTRIDRAQYELSFAEKFDHIVINDDLQQAIEQVTNLFANFLGK